MRGKLDRRKAGISTAVITLIILVIGVALAIIAMSIAGGFLLGWGGAARVNIERADILVDPSTGTAYITVDVRNAGGARLTGCQVTVIEANLNLQSATTDLNPGQTASFSGQSNDLDAGRTYVIQVTCNTPGGGQVSDQKSVLAHI